MVKILRRWEEVESHKEDNCGQTQLVLAAMNGGKRVITPILKSDNLLRHKKPRRHYLVETTTVPSLSEHVAHRRGLGAQLSAREGKSHQVGRDI